jgi:hypothetical protein
MTEAKFRPSTMIFQTTSTGYDTNRYSSLYPPIDPSYVYLEKNMAAGGYHRYPSSRDDKDHFPGYGIERLLENRRKLVDSRITMLLKEISQRYRIKGDNFYHINLDQCGFRNLIFDMGENVWDKRRTEFERKIIDLEQEKRREQASFFKDILFLRKELRDSLMEKLEEEQKAGLLFNQKEEVPWNQ